jgi:Rad3-related DNA helicase
MLDAPTGSGKTLIGDLVRQTLSGPTAGRDTRGVYLCSTLALQEQFARDYPDAAILRGRSNYATADEASKYPELTAADCVKTKTKLPACGDCKQSTDIAQMHCRWCHPVSACPYEIAKAEAFRAELVCSNLTYFLYESNFVGTLALNRGLIVIDEADLIEDTLLDFVTVHVSERQQREYGLDPPEKKTVEASWIEWAYRVEPILDGLARQRWGDDLRGVRKKKSIQRLLADVGRLTNEDDGLASGNWVYTGYDRGVIEFKPVRVDGLAGDFLWRHGERFLLMSASMISFAVLAETLGIS